MKGLGNETDRLPQTKHSRQDEREQKLIADQYVYGNTHIMWESPLMFIYTSIIIFHLIINFM